MPRELLSLHRERFQVGQPTPLRIFDGAGRLLLAHGHIFSSEGQLDNLIDRQAMVDLGELEDTASKITAASPGELPVIWDEAMNAMGRLLRANPGVDFSRSLDEASRPLLALIARDPDLAILQAVRFEAGLQGSQYAIRRAVHTATAACLAADRLGWAEAQSRVVLRTALTMNLSMLELQNRLMQQVTPLTPLQRSEIHAHPERSALILEAAGVTDRDWIDAVRQHHVAEDGSGYPQGQTKISDVAKLVQCADVFTAKFSPRARRPPLPADQAARQHFQSSRGHPFAAALVKEFGLYPPGCAVRLKSGETGLVVRRGESANAPLVAVLADRSGCMLPQLRHRNTAKPEFGVAAVMPMSALKVRVGIEKLWSCWPE